MDEGNQCRVEGHAKVPSSRFAFQGGSALQIKDYELTLRIPMGTAHTLLPLPADRPEAVAKGLVQFYRTVYPGESATATYGRINDTLMTFHDKAYDRGDRAQKVTRDVLQKTRDVLFSGPANDLTL